MAEPNLYKIKQPNTVKMLSAEHLPASCAGAKVRRGNFYLFICYDLLHTIQIHYEN